MPKLSLNDILDEEEEKERLIPEQLASWVEIELIETDTLFLFDIRGVLVSQYSEDASHVLKRNEDYTRTCKENQNNSSLMTDSSVQTCHPLESANEVQSDEIVMKDVGCRASSWDLYDSMNLSFPGGDSEQDINMAETKETRLLKSLQLIECLLSMNLHQEALSAYRQHAIVSAPSKVGPEAAKGQANDLTFLWSLASPLIQQKPVTCFTLNPYDLDMLCAGYGSITNNNQDKGLLCCWALKNLLHPQRCLENPASVVSIDFSQMQPNVLACGLYDGTVVIWDIHSPNGKVLWDSRDHNLFHFGPIWAMKWSQMPVTQRLVNKDVPMHEVLLTASEDGTVCQWDIKTSSKNDLLLLKTRNFQLYHSMSVITETLMRYEPIWSLNLIDSKPDTYMVSTGMGSVHVCSTLHKDKVLKTYKAHQGPIYNLRISPLDNNIFCTCSADCLIKVWQRNSDQCLVTLQTTMNPVYNIDWFPFSSTMFGSVCPDRLDIWDLNVNRLEPLVTRRAGRKEVFTALLFSKNSTSIFVGNDNGVIDTYLITGLENQAQQQIIGLTLEKKTNQ